MMVAGIFLFAILHTMCLSDSYNYISLKIHHFLWLKVFLYTMDALVIGKLEGGWVIQ